MAQNRIPFCRQKEIGWTGTSHTAKLLYIRPVLDNYHESGNSTVGCAVHQFIYHICTVYAIMGKRCAFIIHHNCNGTLILKTLVDPLIRQLTAVHSFPDFFFLYFFHVFFRRLRGGNRFPAKSHPCILRCTIRP